MQKNTEFIEVPYGSTRKWSSHSNTTHESQTKLKWFPDNRFCIEDVGITNDGFCNDVKCNIKVRLGPKESLILRVTRIHDFTVDSEPPTQNKRLC